MGASDSSTPPHPPVRNGGTHRTVPRATIRHPASARANELRVEVRFLRKKQSEGCIFVSCQRREEAVVVLCRDRAPHLPFGGAGQGPVRLARSHWHMSMRPGLAAYLYRPGKGAST